MKLHKMLKTAVIVLAASLVGMSSLSLAATNKGLYYTSLKPIHTKSHLGNSKVGYYPATDITVFNDTNTFVVELVVPDSPVDDNIYPHSQDHVYNDEYSGNTEIVIYDEYGNPIYDRFVWNHAVLHVVFENDRLKVIGG